LLVHASPHLSRNHLRIIKPPGRGAAIWFCIVLEAGENVLSFASWSELILIHLSEFQNEPLRSVADVNPTIDPNSP
jgi:hypothetical protein